MNKYLLLRDNKQSGPLGLEEILALGFKKYDLVWVEGRSAAWRYPGELEEFKQVAPLVEEQPFDRFFKKPAQVKKTELNESASAIREDAAPIPASMEIEQSSVQIGESKHQTGDRQPSIVAEDEHDKYLPAETRRKEPDPQQQASRAQHKYVAVTLPAGRRNNEPKSTYPAPAMQKLEEVKLQEVKPQDLKLSPPRMETPVEKPFQQEVAPALPLLPKTNILLQYSGVAAALISLLVVGILIGIGVNSQPNIQPAYVPAEPTRITELKEKLALRNDPSINSIPVVNQQYQPQQQASRSGIYTEPTPASNRRPSKSAAGASNASVQDNDARSTQEAQQIPPPFNNGEKRVAVKRTDTALNNSPKGVTDFSKQIDITMNEYKVGMFGGIENIQVTLKNRSEITLNEAIVEVRYILSNRKHLTEILRFENIEPGANLTLPAPDSDRGIRLEASIVKLVN